MAKYRVAIEPHPDSQDIQAIRDGLSAYNLRYVPEFLELPHDDIAIFVRDEHNRVQGGLVAEVDWGMMYVDLVWLSENLRGQGYGKQLIHTIEQTTLELGLQHLYLMTTEFQALPFYQHLGYELFGTLQNRPQSYDYYYLRKMNIQTSNLSYGLSAIIDPDPDDVDVVKIGLRKYCEGFVDCSSQLLTALIRDGDGTIYGGISGSTYWDWYDLRYLWIDDCLRGQGYGQRLLQIAEEECLKRKMTGIVCDTADFQALPFYQSQGFEVFATLPDRPPQHDSYFLKKILQ